MRFDGVIRNGPGAAMDEKDGMGHEQNILQQVLAARAHAPRRNDSHHTPVILNGAKTCSLYVRTQIPT
jgi:hypothetical protein